MVVREAVGDRSIAAHAQSLFDLDAKYADVVMQHDAVAYLDRVGYNSARRASAAGALISPACLGERGHDG